MNFIENTPKTWRAPKLGELCEIIGGKAAPQTDDAFTDLNDGLPFVRMRDLGRHHFSNNLTDYSERIHPVYAKANGYTTVPKGTILMPRSGSVGLNHRAILGMDAVIVSHICGLIIKPDEMHTVDTGYLYRLLCQMDMRKICKKTTGLDSIAFSDLAKIRIPLPPLAEQERIAAVLDQADALRAQRRQALARLDDLARALFLHHFGDPVSNPKGWPVVTLENLLSEIESGKSPVCLDRPATNDEWGVLKLGAVTWCDFAEEENKALPPEVTPDSRYEVKAGDLLFSRKNTYEHVAAVSLVRSTRPKLLLPDLIFRLCIKPDAQIITDYLFGVMVHPEKRASIQQLAGGAAASMPNISKAKLMTVPVPVPPLALQRRFAAEIAAVEAQKARQREHLARLDTLFAALQDRAFSGRL